MEDDGYEQDLWEAVALTAAKELADIALSAMLKDVQLTRANDRIAHLIEENTALLAAVNHGFAVDEQSSEDG
jgi:predicted DNA-binding ArsR family transcriptional regulator